MEFIARSTEASEKKDENNCKVKKYCMNYEKWICDMFKCRDYRHQNKMKDKDDWWESFFMVWD